jgi:lysophospholipase L1-like esterase
MVDFEGGLQTPQYTSKYDLVHPNKNGYKVMEEILLNKLNTKGPN